MRNHKQRNRHSLITLTPAYVPAGVPERRMTAMVDTDDGTIYAPADLAPPGELQAMLAFWQDGFEAEYHEDHPFVPLQWLKNEYPEEQELWQTFEELARRGLPPGESVEPTEDELIL